MKRTLQGTLANRTFAILLLMLISGTAFAQKSAGNARPAFDEGDNSIGAFIGFGVDYDYFSNASRTPAIGVTFDHGLIPNVGPGTIGLGGVLAYKAAHYNYGSNGYKATWTDFIIGARGTYHLTILKDKNNKFDPYAGITVGLRISSYKNTDYDARNVRYSSSSVNPIVGAFLGAKYNFAPSFGAFAELGYDISFLRMGVNFNF